MAIWGYSQDIPMLSHMLSHMLSPFEFSQRRWGTSTPPPPASRADTAGRRVFLRKNGGFTSSKWWFCRLENSMVIGTLWSLNSSLLNMVELPLKYWQFSSSQTVRGQSHPIVHNYWCCFMGISCEYHGIRLAHVEILWWYTLGQS
jgi:hypothetical protein